MCSIKAREAVHGNPSTQPADEVRQLAEATDSAKPVRAEASEPSKQIRRRARDSGPNELRDTYNAMPLPVEQLPSDAKLPPKAVMNLNSKLFELRMDAHRLREQKSGLEAHESALGDGSRPVSMVAIEKQIEEIDKRAERIERILRDDSPGPRRRSGPHRAQPLYDRPSGGHGFRTRPN